MFPSRAMSIVEEIRQDREKGAKRLESEYRAGLMALARRFCADESDAEELVNRTFSVVVENIDRYLEQSAFFGWMSRILINCHSKDVRRKSNEMELCTEDIPEDVPDDDACARIFREVDASILRDAIDGLPPDMKETLMLHYFMDMPIKEVARVLSVPSGTVMWRLHYVRKILGAKLGAQVRKNPIMALIAAGLLLLGAAFATTVVVDAVTDNDGGGERTEGTQAIEGMGGSAASTAMSDVPSDERRLPTIADQQPSTTNQLENNEGEQTMSKRKTAAAAFAAALATMGLAPKSAQGVGEYQFIISGYPAANPSYPKRSAAITLETGAVRAHGAADDLEARSRSKGRSSAIMLDATKFNAMVIIVM